MYLAKGCCDRREFAEQCFYKWSVSDRTNVKERRISDIGCSPLQVTSPRYGADFRAVLQAMKFLYIPKSDRMPKLGVSILDNDDDPDDL
ncbi:uncharacterized protein LOC143020562 isoform X3 [Oratosquilla oratoria]|uniref:uncharacterized protein LOC143020562 isoform X3 n=1 Tax=Oratosquilla oratoria TaxID=337810 RepID=UPI003F75D178